MAVLESYKGGGGGGAYFSLRILIFKNCILTKTRLFKFGKTTLPHSSIKQKLLLKVTVYVLTEMYFIFEMPYLEAKYVIHFKHCRQRDERLNYNLQYTNFLDVFYASENKNERKIETENKIC